MIKEGSLPTALPATLSTALPIPPETNPLQIDTASDDEVIEEESGDGEIELSMVGENLNRKKIMN